MQIDKSKYDSNGNLKNGVVTEYFQDGSVSCVGEFIDGEKTGEWRTYDAAGKLTKTTRHKRLP